MSVTGPILTPGVVFAPRQPVLPRFPLQPEGLFRDGTAGALMDASALALAGRALFYTDAGNTAAEPGENIHTFLDTARARLWSSGAAYGALEGSHATQATTSQQPVLGSAPSRGVVNDFTDTETGFVGWTNNASVTTGYVASPVTGEMTASRFHPVFETDPGASSKSLRIYERVSTSIGEIRCFSLYIKPVQPISRYPNPPDTDEEDRDVRVSLGSDDALLAIFNCRTLSIEVTNAGTEAGVIPMAGGWYRIWAANKASQDDVADNHIIYFSNRNNISFDPYPDGTEDILFSDPQTEIVDSLTQGPSAFQSTDRTHLYVTEPGVPSFSFLRFDTVDDKLSQVMPDGLNGDVMIFGRNGSWIDTGVTIAPGGTLTAINGANSVNTPGIISVLGDIVGWLALDRAITSKEQADLLAYYAKRGAGGLYTLGPELVVNGTFDTDLSGWTEMAGSTATWNAGRMEVVSTSGSEWATYQKVPTEANERYLVSLGYFAKQGGGRCYFGTSPSDSGAGGGNIPIGTFANKELIAPSNGLFISMGEPAASGALNTYDEISVRKLVQS